MRKERKDCARVPKGYIPVLVGADDKESERFLVPMKHLRHPRVADLLEMAVAEFGYEQKGILTIPCDVQYFRGVLQVVSKSM